MRRRRLEGEGEWGEVKGREAATFLTNDAGRVQEVTMKRLSEPSSSVMALRSWNLQLAFFSMRGNQISSEIPHSAFAWRSLIKVDFGRIDLDQFCLSLFASP